ncbi:MAG: redoxin domain-containing protein [Calothrix sp. CSU_2_0]|nr:redoxin domain-containing protein [Calothrix sp. CSU_2_0]
MKNRVRAPQFPEFFNWLNTDNTLSIKELKGRIIVLDFWTYCCINCLHILPDLKYLEQKYQDSLIIIGVHSAKFENENDIENIRQAILRYDIEHPVIVDRNFKIWQDYAIRAYPTLIIIDPQGYIVGSFVGEGKRDILEELIKQIIEQNSRQNTINFQQLNFTLEKLRSPIITPLAFPGKVLVTNIGLFIADTGHNRIIQTSFDGETINIIGNGKAGLIDANFAETQFSAPQGMTVDEENQVLYVADTNNHVIRQIDLIREQVKTIAGTGKQSRNIHPHYGNALETALNSPWDLVKVEKNLFIAIAGSHQVWKMDLDGNIIGTYAGTGAEACYDSNLLESVFAQPSGIATDGCDLYVADSENSTVRALGLGESPRVRTICGSGNLFEFGDRDGIGSDVLLQHCLGAEYAEGNVWIADTYNHKIKCINLSTGECKTVLGSGEFGLKDGVGTNAQFSEPSGLSILDYFLYIADTNNHVIRQVDLNSLEVTTLNFTGLCSPDFVFQVLYKIGSIPVFI